MQPLLNIAINAARQAGDIILRYADQIDRIKISEKTQNDFFSEVDIKAEQTIIQTFTKLILTTGLSQKNAVSFERMQNAFGLLIL